MDWKDPIDRCHPSVSFISCYISETINFYFIMLDRYFLGYSHHVFN